VVQFGLTALGRAAIFGVAIQFKTVHSRKNVAFPTTFGLYFLTTHAEWQSTLFLNTAAFKKTWCWMSTLRKMDIDCLSLSLTSHVVRNFWNWSSSNLLIWLFSVPTNLNSLIALI
jgi:hypothetical protein